jgi:hypothetical protein
MRKGKPKGDGTRLETGRDHPSGGARALRVRLPLLPPAVRGTGPMARRLASNQAIGVRLPDPALDVMIDASLAERSGAGFPGSIGGFDSRGALSGIG